MTPSSDAHDARGQQFTRAAGVAVPLWSLQGAEDLGTGDILDLIPFIDWLARWQHRVVQLLPINEAGPEEASPYSALSAFAIDPSYIALAHVPEITASTAARRWLGGAQVRRKRSAWSARRSATARRSTASSCACWSSASPSSRRPGPARAPTPSPRSTRRMPGGSTTTRCFAR